MIYVYCINIESKNNFESQKFKITFKFVFEILENNEIKKNSIVNILFNSTFENFFNCFDNNDFSIFVQFHDSMFHEFVCFVIEFHFWKYSLYRFVNNNVKQKNEIKATNSNIEFLTNLFFCFDKIVKISCNLRNNIVENVNVCCRVLIMTRCYKCEFIDTSIVWIRRNRQINTIWRMYVVKLVI